MERRSRHGQVDYYTALGVPEDASFREIEAAYWRQALVNRELLPLLNEAYEVLGHAERRIDYDAKCADAPLEPAKARSKTPATLPRRSRLHELLG